MFLRQVSWARPYLVTLLRLVFQIKLNVFPLKHSQWFPLFHVTPKRVLKEQYGEAGTEATAIIVWQIVGDANIRARECQLLCVAKVNISKCVLSACQQSVLWSIPASSLFGICWDAWKYKSSNQMEVLALIFVSNVVPPLYDLWEDTCVSGSFDYFLRW